MTRPEPHRPVRRRVVFYIPGYDPMPPRAYRERYRREAARQAELSGHSIGLEPQGSHAWRILARIEGAEVESDIHVLYWADIVRASMVRSIGATYAALVRTAWTYLSSGALFRLMRLRRGPVIAALFPVMVLLTQFAVALALGGLAAVAVNGGLGLALSWGAGAGVRTQPPGSGWVLVASLGVGAFAARAMLRWLRRRDHVLAWYLMQDYAFSASGQGAYPDAQEARLAQFADRIADALQGDVDEVLVVGHSSGAHLAVSVLADLIRAGRLPGDGPVVSLLTLGQVIPMVSFLPRAGRLRADLALMSETACASWVDVTAPGDGCAFALCDPVAVSGVAGPDKRWPLVLSAAFSQTLSPGAWSALRWRFFERHFQYLNAFDNLGDGPGAYDYFAVTAGPQTLLARFSGRAPSASRIETAVNRHTDRAA
jgi:hypothetical protein